MKRLVIIFITTLFGGYMIAQSVSKEFATQMAIRYMEQDISNAAPADFAWLTRGNSIDTSYTQSFSLTGKAPLYLVQLPQGWVLVSSEFVTTPVLASAPIGQFPDTIDMPDGMKWLLSYYEDAMQYTRDSMSLNIDSARYAWEHIYDISNMNSRDATTLPPDYEIDSIGSFKWGQDRNNEVNEITPDCDKVYNKFCPTWYPVDSACQKTVTGCMAVAMGLVMRYYRWPHAAIIPNTIDTAGQGSTAKHFVVYDWNRMPGTIYNSTDVAIVDEIAGFLRDCGYAARMKYQAHGSGTDFDSAKVALNGTFQYANVQRNIRNSYGSGWINKLKTEIAAGRPIIYGGDNGGGEGHAFVLYGYTEIDQFLINWGWRGDFNGAFYLNDLQPNAMFNFNYNHIALWHISPSYPSCDPIVVPPSAGSYPNFVFLNGGPISIGNRTITSNMQGVIFSQESVTLTSGFKIEAGAHVYIDIKDLHCDDRNNDPDANEDTPIIFHTPQTLTANTNNPPAATKILRDGHIFILVGDRTYTITGQRVE